MKRRVVVLALCLLAIGCERDNRHAPPPPAPSASASAPAAFAARPTAGDRIAGFELELNVQAVSAASAASASHRLGTVVLAALRNRAGVLVEWDLAAGAPVRRAPWPDALPEDGAALSLARIDGGWVTLTAGSDAFESPTRVTRLSSDLQHTVWSQNLPPGVYAAVAADASTIAVTQQRPGKVQIATFDASTGAPLAARAVTHSGPVLPRTRPFADVIVAHGFVYAALPTRVVRWTRTLQPSGARDLKFQSGAGELAPSSPRLAATETGLLVSRPEENKVLALDAALRDTQRWTLSLGADALLPTKSGFVTSSGLAPGGRRFSWQRPGAWTELSNSERSRRGLDKGVFERRFVLDVHGHTVLVVTCCGHTAILTAQN